MYLFVVIFEHFWTLLEFLSLEKFIEGAKVQEAKVKHTNNDLLKVTLKYVICEPKI